MELTNNHGMPGGYYRLCKKDTYDPQGSDITVTSLISPPMQKALQFKWDKAISVDCVDSYYSFMGRVAHQMLDEHEIAAKTEERLFMDIFGWKISGQYDRLSLSQKTLQDYKMTSIWELIYGLKPERENQLNLLAELAIRHGYPISRLEIIFLCRDWSVSKIQYDSQYPKAPMKRVAVPMWDQEKRLDYLMERVILHQAARIGLYNICTDEERWYTGNKYAVMKKGAKRAVKLFDQQTLADTFIENHKDAKKLFVEHRPGDYRRCDNYCLVKKWCPEYEHDPSNDENRSEDDVDSAFSEDEPPF